ncbi:putative ABC transport system ATP-binding protein [Desulfobotulus alkaliphilus]|uniref:Putative ABC transport system ATP-binding protein n=1 Tax=Desulfobotulus alkaliphilus TaxID=622671 RepID=A0A562RML3_9BACT|nr:ABC transporter ATP-binding protein [Desulfobotulus alkaliphilus]TWI70281.1 putative ABC transport system ATP-binding protein [Desulfobotulus alkaliphilus]
MIRAQALEKSYQVNGRTLAVIHPMDLYIKAASFAAIQGRSGSGKTTLLTLLSGLDRPTGGRLVLDEDDITDWPESRMAAFRNKKIGFVFQDFHLIPGMTALENVLFPAELSGNAHARERAESLLRQVGLWERRKHLPRQLSGGEQQRVAICRAVVNRPKIIFADEPTGNLDSAAADGVMQLLVDLKEEEGATLVVVTHSAEVAEQADRVITLSDGEVAHDSGA